MWSAGAPTTTREARVLPQTAAVPALGEDLGTSAQGRGTQIVRHRKFEQERTGHVARPRRKGMLPRVAQSGKAATKNTSTTDFTDFTDKKNPFPIREIREIRGKNSFPIDIR
jgi:hypothetical protein